MLTGAEGDILRHLQDSAGNLISTPDSVDD